MSTLSALLVLGQGAFLSASWWLGRALRGDADRVAGWVVWPALGLSIAGAAPEIVTAVAGAAHLANLAHLAGLCSVGAMAVSQAGLSAVAGGRAVRTVSVRRRLAAEAMFHLERGDAAFATGRSEEARAAYQAVVSAGQGAADMRAMRLGLARIAWIDYLGGEFEQARASIGWAADGGAMDDALGSEVMLLAGCLAMAAGRLDVARLAVEDATRMAESAQDASQAGLASIVLGCEHYLEGWTESGRAHVEAHLEDPLERFDQHAAGALVLALSLAARHRGHSDDAQALAGLAEALLKGDQRLEPLARHAADPDASAGLDGRARAVMALLLPVAAAPARA